MSPSHRSAALRVSLLMSSTLEGALFAYLLEGCEKSYLSALPNPNVGALVLKDGQVLGIGYHEKAGMPHAEVIACFYAYCALKGIQSKELRKKLEDAADARRDLIQDDKHEITKNQVLYCYLMDRLTNKDDAKHSDNKKDIFKGCTIYVTLEPCAHFGKTPPCSELLAYLGFSKVKVAALEYGANSGALEALGGELCSDPYIQNRAKNLLYPFMRLLQTGRLNIFKIAEDLCGEYRGGAISCEESRLLSHRLRAVASSITIGGSTLRHDDPRLSAYLCDDETPDINILSAKLEASELGEFKMAHCQGGKGKSGERASFEGKNSVDKKGRKIHLARNISELALLISKGVNIIEGSHTLLCDLARARLVDMVQVIIAPKILGENYSTALVESKLVESNCANLAPLKPLLSMMVGTDTHIYLVPKALASSAE